MQTKLAVSSPDDPLERAADTVASRVTGSAPSSSSAGSTGDGRLQRASESDGLTTPAVSPEVEAIVTGVSGGAPLPAATRTRIESHLGVDLSPVRVHTGPQAAAAAAGLQARAFTRGANVFLAAGESVHDVALIAHESAHVVQQGAAGPLSSGPPAPGLTADAPLQRKVSGLDLPGAGYVIDALRLLPGYLLVSQIIGEDPLSGEAVTVDRADLVQTLLGFGPFAGAVGPVLQALEALEDIVSLVMGRLAEHNLTLSRIMHDIAAAWDEVHLADGIDANVAVVRRYVNALLADVRAFAKAVAADVIAAVRAAAVSFAEPLVQTPEIKPIWDLGVKVFHYDPLKGQRVDVPTVEILADFLRLIGKEAALAQMQERGTLQKTADWLDLQFGTFTTLLSQATTLFADAWAAIAPQNLPNLVSNLESLARRAYALLKAMESFAQTVITQVLELIKHSLLGMLSEHAHKVPGFHLLTVILGRDPFTGEAVARNAENLIKGFITLLPNGEAMYEQLAQAGVIADAAGRIETAMTQLNITWELVTGTFRAIWDGLRLEDLLDPVGAFTRIVDQFGEPLSRLIRFAATVVGVVIELILKLMNFPSDLLANILANAQAAIEDIKRDPIAFLQNVVLAMKQGVVGFLDKIGQYLLQGLTDWLFRGLRGLGIEPPANLSLESIITLVLQVLGVTVETLWTKLGAKIGPERVAQIRSAIDKAGEAWRFIKDVQERGISAIWEFISGQLSNLWDMILQKAKDWIMSEIVDKVTAKLISMLDPTGVMAVVNSCIAFFNAIQSAIEYLREILQIIDRYVSTIASVARGDVAPGAAMLEQGLASAVPVAIGFLANQVGLGNVPEKVAEIIQGLRELIDQALDWLFDQAWRLGQAALSALGLGGVAPAASGAGHGALPESRISFTMNGEAHSLWFEKVGTSYQIYMASTPGYLKAKVDKALADKELPAGARGPLGLISGPISQLEAEVSEHERLYSGDTDPLASQFFGNKEFTRPQYLQEVQKIVAQYRAYLEGIGNDFKIKDLMNLGHRSKFVEGDSVKQAYRGAGVWRKEFYGSWAAGLDERFWKPHTSSALAYWRSIHPGGQIPANFDLYQCSWCHEWFSHAGGVPGYPIRPRSIDHKEAVVAHWNKEGGGRFMVQADRVAWYNLESNLQPMCRSCNQESEDAEHWTVHRRFRGKADAPADPSDEP